MSSAKQIFQADDEQMYVDCCIRLVAMEGISVEDVENPEIEALPSVENQRAGDDEEAAAGVQDHYQGQQSLAKLDRLSYQPASQIK